MIHVRTTANEAFLRLLDLDNEKVRQAVANALNETALHGQALIVEDTPVQTARLRNSIDVELATPDHLVAAIVTNVEYAAAVEFGTGIYSEAPGAPRQPFKIQAKNPRTITYTRNGKTITRTVLALTWFGQIYGEPQGSKGWTSRKEVTIQGAKPAAMFRKNVPAIEAKLQEALRKHVGGFLGGQE